MAPSTARTITQLTIARACEQLFVMRVRWGDDTDVFIVPLGSMLNVGLYLLVDIPNAGFGECKPSLWCLI
jgi:hypothetical protein